MNAGMTMYQNQSKQLVKVGNHIMESTSANHPQQYTDAIIRANEKVMCVLIDVAIFGDRNVIKKEAEKILIYKDLAIEILCMWNATAEVIPVTTGATETISKTVHEPHTGKSRNQVTLHVAQIVSIEQLRHCIP